MSLRVLKQNIICTFSKPAVFCGLAFLCLLILASGFFFQFSKAATGAPKILNHQGRLFDSDGNILGGSGTNYCFRFSIYNAASNGSKLWPSGSPSTMTVLVKNGVFNVGIGDTAAGGDVLDFNFQDNDTVYLNVDVASQNMGSCSGASFETLLPRQRIMSSGFAVNANTVAGFVPSQLASGNQIPVLTGGNLLLAGANPQISATSTNSLVLQSASSGDIQFFNSSNKLTSTGNLTVAGSITGTLQENVSSL
jgi:hypothetical protein